MRMKPVKAEVFCDSSVCVYDSRFKIDLSIMQPALYSSSPFMLLRKKIESTDD